jgi:hypothetical protein
MAGRKKTTTIETTRTGCTRTISLINLTAMQKYYKKKELQQARFDFADAQTMFVYVAAEKDKPDDTRIILSDTRIEPPKGYEFIAGKIDGRHL